jgi:hypothetical protein
MKSLALNILSFEQQWSLFKGMHLIFFFTCINISGSNQEAEASSFLAHFWILLGYFTSNFFLIAM